MPRPLAGVRVVDFSRLLPGPYATLVLADLGAEVVKVESPKGGDYLRWMPPLTGAVSHAFNALNCGKRSIALDLKRPEGAEVARRLAASADIVLESFRPGVMDRLGLGYAALRELNPRVIYCAISGFGQDGPFRDRPGHDLNYAAIGGAMGLAGPSEGRPAVPPIQMGDFGGSLWALVGILAALNERHQTGLGRLVDVSMTDAVLAYLSVALAPHINGAAPPPPRGADTLIGGQPVYRTYETADGGFFTLGALEPKFWVAFCQAVERPGWVRRQYGDPTLGGDLEALFATRTRAEWDAVLSKVDACCEPVIPADELTTHPVHLARGNFINDAAGNLRVRTPVCPPGGDPPTVAPRLGEHTRTILSELGYDEAGIDALIAARAAASVA